MFEFFEASRADEKPIVVKPYSSDLSASERKTILEKFKNQEINMSVASTFLGRC